MTMRRAQNWIAVSALALLLGLGSCSRPAATNEETTVAAACPPAQPDMAASNYQELYAQAAQGGEVRVIVRVVSPAGVQPAGDLQESAVAAFERAGVDYVEPLGTAEPLIVAEVNAEQLRALYADPRFPEWSEDRIAFPTLAESVPLIEGPEIWDLGGRGAGQAVAILDTGVDAAHPFLAQRVVAEACFSTTSQINNARSLCPNGQSQQRGAGAARPCSAAGCEHGTHVAGIAAGQSETFSGVAPDADIIAVQVFSLFSGPQCGGRGACVASFTSDQIRALDYVLQLARDRAVASVNMSLGGGRSTTACDTDLAKTVIDQLRAAGVATAIASGNDGFRDSVSFPACISSAITVGATSKSDELAGFSNCGPQVDVHAPGVNIRSSTPNGNFAVLSGTSMATPHVAGAFAALRSARPAATVDQIELALEQSGTDVGGRPRIRLFAALQRLGGAAPVANTAMAEPTSMLQSGVAALAALPADRPARFIVSVDASANREQALARAEAAAQQAGARGIARLGNQPMLVLEATPSQMRTLVRSGAITGLQADRPAQTQSGD